MFKQFVVAPSHEKIFIRQALFNNNIRLDGRGLEDIRAITIHLVRNEITCHSEVQWGSTIVIAVVSCKIITPFPDRANEGILHFNTELSAQADASGYSHAEISRLLEKIIKESETLDTESLCIVNGEKVWEIKCDLRIVDASGGNIIDASILATIAALKGFRKPEISFLSRDNSGKTEGGGGKLIIHHSDERDPLPLALHHTPLTLSLGIAKKGGQTQSGEKLEAGKEKFVLIVDPSSEEESAIDGIISFSINSFNEVCSINKPGGVSLPVYLITKAGHLAIQKIQILHEKLNQSLENLEKVIIKEREIRVEQARQYRQQILSLEKDSQSNPMDIIDNEEEEIVGIDKNDPILQWSNLHFPVPLKE